MQQNTKSNRVMESGNHFKNGASRKSRNNISMFGILLFTLELIISVFTSCSKDNPLDEPGAIPVTGISLNQTNLTLNKGQTYTLTATVKPDSATNKKVAWSSSDTSKVSVNNSGVVTAVATGTATITASAEGKTATCIITVSESTAEIPVQDITLNTNSLDLFTGNIGKEPVVFLVATIKPDNATNKTITWSSSNTSVAEVIETGSPVFPYVYARGKGTATITAKAGDKTATCKVNVLDITFGTQSDIELVVGEEYTLTATTNPAGQSVTWTSTNTSKATVEGNYGTGNVIAKSSGTLNINATYQGQTISWNLTVYDMPVADITIDGVTWAARNVNTPGTFAGKASDIGMFYQWNSRLGYSTDPQLNTYSTGTEWTTENDPSPTGYRVPTEQEAESLQQKVAELYVRNMNNLRTFAFNGTLCYIYIFDGGQVMVLPTGSYWTKNTYGADGAYVYTTNVVSGSGRKFAHYVRCVRQ